MTGLIIKKKMPEKLGGTGVYDIGHTCNSLLGGLVAITAGCATLTPQHSILTGFLGAFVYHGASCMMRRLKIDDPLDPFAVHGACGFWGVIAVGLFTKKEYSWAPAGCGTDAPSAWCIDSDGNDLGVDAGLFMPGTRGTLFATQVLAAIIEVIWVSATSGILFFALKLAGIFRVSAEDEQIGSDLSKHGGSAYPAAVEAKA